MRFSRIKAKLRRGEPTLLTTCHYVDPSIYEMVSLLGFDGIWMDLEHHTTSSETAANLMRAARVGSADIIARPAKGEFMRMARLLEAGAQGIMYPRCETGEEAAEVARWARFAPQGERGIDGANPDNPYCYAPMAPYIKLANEHTLLMVQIESPKAVENVEAIAAVPGVDMLFIGPGDLSVLAGVPFQFDHPIIHDAYRRVAAAAKKAGKWWGTTSPSAEHSRMLLDLGANLVAHGADILMVKLGFEAIQANYAKLGFTFDNRLADDAALENERMSRRHRVLVVGGGSIGERHVRCFAATGRAELSLCEINPAVREAVAERCAVSRAHDRFETALDERPEVVVIATPAPLHVPMASAAVRAGAAVLVEKPLSVSQEGVDELARLVDERRVTLAVAYVYRCHPALAALRAALNDGRFGTPCQIVATCGQHFPLYRPAYRDIYYKDRARGGGAVQDALTHIVNAGEWLVGPIDRLVADVAHQVLEGVEVEDTVHVIARHGDVMGSYSLNQHQAPNEVTLSVVCRAGTARFEYHANRWRWMREPGGEWNDESCGQPARDDLFVKQAGAFLDAVEGLVPPLCTLNEARQTLGVNLAILRSAQRGEWETIQPAETIHG